MGRPLETEGEVGGKIGQAVLGMIQVILLTTLQYLFSQILQK